MFFTLVLSEILKRNKNNAYRMLKDGIAFNRYRLGYFTNNHTMGKSALLSFYMNKIV